MKISNILTSAGLLTVISFKEFCRLVPKEDLLTPYTDEFVKTNLEAVEFYDHCAVYPRIKRPLLEKAISDLILTEFETNTYLQKVQLTKPLKKIISKHPSCYQESLNSTIFECDVVEEMALKSLNEFGKPTHLVEFPNYWVVLSLDSDTMRFFYYSDLENLTIKGAFILFEPRKIVITSKIY